MFRESYTNNVEVGCLKILSEVENLSDTERILVLDVKVKKILLKADRKAESDSGLITRNGIRKGYVVICSRSNDILNIMSEIKDKRLHGVPNNSVELKNLKKKLRKLQRLSIFDRCRDDSLKLENMLHNNRGTFWKKISCFKKLKRKTAKFSSEKLNY